MPGSFLTGSVRNVARASSSPRCKWESGPSVALERSVAILANIIDDAEPTEHVQPPVASATARRIAAATMAAPASSSSDAAATAEVTSA